MGLLDRLLTFIKRTLLHEAVTKHQTPLLGEYQTSLLVLEELIDRLHK
jgi:hypothetical protein